MPVVVSALLFAAVGLVCTVALPADADTGYWKVKRAAEHLGYSVKGIYDLINAGELPAVYVGSRRAIRVKAEDVEALLRPVPTTEKEPA